MTDAFDVAVVGGGAAGTFFVHELLRRDQRLRILWLTADGSVGVAYETRSASHLLNVPAARMGASVDRPRDFLDWLDARDPERRIGEADFVPRSLYGRYLQDLRDRVRADPRVEHRAMTLSQAEPVVVDAASLWRIVTVEGMVSHARRVVLAIGVTTAPRGAPSGAQDAAVIRDPWQWLRRRPEGWRPPGPEEEIMVLGSGLTAMDVVVGLRDLGFSGVIRVVSRSGRWSERHEPTAPLAEALRASLLSELLARPTSRSYLQVLRRHAATHPWRAVIDALRPASQDLWSALPPVERRRFLRHVFSVWNRHRHRSPPATADRVLADPRVILEKGRWPAARRSAATILDCRGFGLASAREWPPCIGGLMSQGALVTSAAGVGLESRLPDSLALLGALRFGAEFECTAVPELRAQAAAVVDDWTRRDYPRLRTGDMEA